MGCTRAYGLHRADCCCDVDAACGNRCVVCRVSSEVPVCGVWCAARNEAGDVKLLVCDDICVQNAGDAGGDAWRKEGAWALTYARTEVLKHPIHYTRAHLTWRAKEPNTDRSHASPHTQHILPEGGLSTQQLCEDSEKLHV